MRAVDTRLDDLPSTNVLRTEVVIGDARFEVIDFAPRPDHGCTAGRLLVTQHGGEVLDAGAPMHLDSNVPGDHICGRAEIAIRRPAYFMLTYDHRPGPPTEADILRLLEETVRGWRMWSKTCALPSLAPDCVLRSALGLELHAYVDTGAIIAAATTRIPEAIDAAMTIGALLDVRDGRVRAWI